LISPPETFDPLANRYILQMDHLNLQPEKLLSLPDIIKHMRVDLKTKHDGLLALPDILKHMHVDLKHKRVELLSLLDSFKIRQIVLIFRRISYLHCQIVLKSAR
jgi:hypothetical protein